MSPLFGHWHHIHFEQGRLFMMWQIHLHANLGAKEGILEKSLKQMPTDALATCV